MKRLNGGTLNCDIDRGVCLISANPNDWVEYADRTPTGEPTVVFVAVDGKPIASVQAHRGHKFFKFHSAETGQEFWFANVTGVTIDPAVGANIVPERVAVETIDRQESGEYMSSVWNF